jgi:hypothetical protein
VWVLIRINKEKFNGGEISYYQLLSSIVLGRGALPEEKAAMCFSGIKSTLKGLKHETIFYQFLLSTGPGVAIRISRFHILVKNKLIIWRTLLSRGRILADSAANFYTK